MASLVLKKQEPKCSEWVDNMVVPFQSQLKISCDKNVAVAYTVAGNLQGLSLGQYVLLGSPKYVMFFS